MIKIDKSGMEFNARSVELMAELTMIIQNLHEDGMPMEAFYVILKTVEAGIFDKELHGETS